MVRPNQMIIQDFLNSLLKIVAEGSSDKYVLMVLSKFRNEQIRNFPFLEDVHIDLKKITVDKKINSVSPKSIGKFLETLVHSLFSNLFMLLVKRKMPPRLIKDLEYLGININN